MDSGDGPGRDAQGSALWQNDPLLRQSSGEFREKFFFQREAVQDVHDSRRCGAEWRKEIALRALYELAEQYVKEKSSWEENGASAQAQTGETGIVGGALDQPSGVTPHPTAQKALLMPPQALAGNGSGGGMLGTATTVVDGVSLDGAHTTKAAQAGAPGGKAREGRPGRSGGRNHGRGGSGGGSERGGGGRGGASKPVPEGLYKTKMCYHFLGAGCALEAECNFAHGEHELRVPPSSSSAPSPLSGSSDVGTSPNGVGGRGGPAGRGGKARRWSGPGLNGGGPGKVPAPAPGYVAPSGLSGYPQDGMRTPERSGARGRRSSGGTSPSAWAGAAPFLPGNVSPLRTPPNGKGPPIAGLKIAVAGGEDDSPDAKMRTPKWARELVGSAELGD